MCRIMTYQRRVVALRTFLCGASCAQSAAITGGQRRRAGHGQHVLDVPQHRSSDEVSANGDSGHWRDQEAQSSGPQEARGQQFDAVRYCNQCHPQLM